MHLHTHALLSPRTHAELSPTHAELQALHVQRDYTTILCVIDSCSIIDLPSLLPIVAY